MSSLNQLARCHQFQRQARSLRALGCCWLLIVVGFFGGCSASVQSRLEQIVASQKKDLPRKIDNVRTLIDVTTGPKELINVYQTTLPIETVVKNMPTMKTETENYLRKNVDSLRDLSNYQIKVTNIYQDPAGKELARFSVNPWEL